MKRYIRKRHCGPEGLEVVNIPTPEPAEDEVLVKVQATSINPADSHTMRGTPYFYRLMLGVSRPKNPKLGADLSGIIEKVGANVNQWQVGDEVFSDILSVGAGAFGEYICVKQQHLVRKPNGISHQAAAAVPLAGITALQSVTSNGSLKPGQQVMIIGAGGGVGTFLVQLAKHYGAEVTAVCSTGKAEKVKMLGATEIIDYTREDYRNCQKAFDLIIDAVGNCSAGTAKKLLKPNGTCLLIGWGGFGHLISYILYGWWIGLRTDRKISILTAQFSTADLSTLGSLIEAGAIVPVIDKIYSFKELPQAIAYQELGHSGGKVVVTLSNE